MTRKHYPFRQSRLNFCFNMIGVVAILILFTAGLCAGVRERRRMKTQFAEAGRQPVRHAAHHA